MDERDRQSGMIAPQRHDGKRPAGGLHERLVKPLSQIFPLLADSGDRTGRHFVGCVEIPGQAKLEIAFPQPVQEIIEKRRMQRRGLGGGKISDQPGFHPALPGRLGEKEQASARHGAEF
jgi:hypothetical protein